MLPKTLNLDGIFKKASFSDWKALADADLRGASFEQRLITSIHEGVRIQPLYSGIDQPVVHNIAAASGLPPFVRGTRPLGRAHTGWDIRVEHADADLNLANQAILADLEGGATSLVIRLDAAARQGLDPTDFDGLHLAGRDGICLSTVDDLDTLFRGVHLNMVHISLEAGAAFIPAASLLAALWERRGYTPSEIRGCFQADPLAVLARDGHLPYAIDEGLAMLGDLAAWTRRIYPEGTVRAVRVGTAAYHHAGATATQDLAIALATGAEYLRAMMAAGLSIDEAAKQIQFSFAVGSNIFLAAAKLRAGRWLWHRLVTASGGQDASAAMQMYVRPSRRIMATRDVWVNVLRSTACLVAAAVGGADAIGNMPHDAPIGPASPLARRLARNTHHILMEECLLHQVCDPAGGSWYIESLTQDLAGKAWEIFQTIEREGGMTEALTSGWIAAQIENSLQPRLKDLASRKQVLVGVSDFVDPTEQPPEPTWPDYRAIAKVAATRLAIRTIKPIEFAPDAGCTEQALSLAKAGASIGQIARAVMPREDAENLPSALSVHAFAEPFERLREQAENYAHVHGDAPSVLCILLDSSDALRARLAFCEHLLEAGGLACELITDHEDAAAIESAIHDRHAKVAMIIGADAQYPGLVPVVAPMLHRLGARCVVLAGNPGANEHAYRQAGIDRFAYLKADAAALLAEIMAITCGDTAASLSTQPISTPPAELRTGHLS